MDNPQEIKREKVRVVPIKYIDDFPDHPFKVVDNESMEQLKDISDAIAELENERLALGVENADCLKPEELIPIGEDDDIRGKVVALHERELIDGCKDITRF